jgi:hypothetical protein
VEGREGKGGREDERMIRRDDETTREDKRTRGQEDERMKE